MTKLRVILSVSLMYFFSGHLTIYARSYLERIALAGNSYLVERHLASLDSNNTRNTEEVRTVLLKVQNMIQAFQDKNFTILDMHRTLGELAKIGIYGWGTALMFNVTKQGFVVYEQGACPLMCRSHYRNFNSFWLNATNSAIFGMILFSIKTIQHTVRCVKSSTSGQATSEHRDSLLIIQDKLTQFLEQKSPTL